MDVVYVPFIFFSSFHKKFAPTLLLTERTLTLKKFAFLSMFGRNDSCMNIPSLNTTLSYFRGRISEKKCVNFETLMIGRMRRCDKDASTVRNQAAFYNFLEFSPSTSE
jgi:hypothetical protein